MDRAWRQRPARLQWWLVIVMLRDWQFDWQIQRYPVRSGIGLTSPIEGIEYPSSLQQSQATSASRTVKPPRKLWGFDSLPAHHPNFEFRIDEFVL